MAVDPLSAQDLLHPMGVGILVRILRALFSP